MEHKTPSSSHSGGIGFAGLLAIVFITLRLTDTIDWSWLWVLSPIWIPLAFALGVLAAVTIVAGLLLFVAWVKA